MSIFFFYKKMGKNFIKEKIQTIKKSKRNRSDFFILLRNLILNYLTASFKALPALNTGIFVAGIVISFLV